MHSLRKLGQYNFSGSIQALNISLIVNLLNKHKTSVITSSGGGIFTVKIYSVKRGGVF